MQQGDRHYRLFIAQPKQPQTAYTVLYMLDGNGQFPMMINRLSAGKTRRCRWWWGSVIPQIRLTRKPAPLITHHRPQPVNSLLQAAVNFLPAVYPRTGYSVGEQSLFC